MSVASLSECGFDKYCDSFPFTSVCNFVKFHC